MTTTAEDLDALPHHALVQVIEKHGDAAWAWNYFYFGKSFSGWLELDPSDRYDGESTVESGYLLSKARGFGRQDPNYGSVNVLFVPEASA